MSGPNNFAGITINWYTSKTLVAGESWPFIVNLNTGSTTAPGTYILSYTATSGDLSQTAQFTMVVATAPTTTTAGTVSILATMNGQAYTGAVACGFLNSPSNITVNSVPFSQNNLPVGTYNLGCAGGPPNSQLQSFMPSSSQSLAAGGTITFTAAYIWATVTVYPNPLSTPPPGASWTWSLSAWQSSGSTWTTQPVLTFYGTDYRFNHPQGYIEAFKQLKNWGSTGPVDDVIAQFQAVLPNWPPYVVVAAPSQPGGALSGYCAVNGSTAAQSFQTGNQIIWNANVSGGTGADSFAWSGVFSGGTRQSQILIPSSPATYNISVLITDSGNPQQQINLTCPQVTVVVAPSGTLGCGCSVSPSPINLGSGATLSAACIGGTGSYQFQLPDNNGFSSSYSALVMPTSKGTQNYIISGKDSSGATASGSCSLNVN